MYFFFSWANGCFWNCECDCFVLGGVIKVGFVLSENAVWSLIWLILHSMNMLFLFQLMSCVFKHTNPADPSQHTQHWQQQDLNPAKNSNPNTQTTIKTIPKSPKKKKKKPSKACWNLSLAAEIVSEAFAGYLGDEPKFRLPSRSVSF